MRSLLEASRVGLRQPSNSNTERARRLEALLVLVTFVACFGAWSANDGGYEETWWYPAALVLLLLGFVLTWAQTPRRLSSWATAALAAFAAYTAWSFLSIAWAGDRGLALTGANRTLLYLIILIVAARVRWQSREATSALALWGLATVTAGAVRLGAAAVNGNVEPQFFDGRLATPIGYANANAALFVLATWPFLSVFIDRNRPVWLRATACGCAAIASGLALLSQSKGAAIGTFAAVLVVALIVPRRAPFLFVVTLLAAVLAVLHGPLLGLYDHLQSGDATRRALVVALVALAAAFAISTVVGGAFAYLSTRVTASAPRAVAVTAQAFVATAAVASALAVVAAVVHYGGPTSTARDLWRSFVHPPGGSDGTSHFLSAAGNHRYDFWRVAAHQFEHSPLVGAGADNFAADYVRERRSDEEPLYPHSLEARVLGGTGSIGFLLFAAFLAAATVPLLRGVRSQSDRAMLGLAALGMLTYWLAHGSVDWLWEFPGLTGPAFLALGATLGVEQLPAGQRSRGRNLRLPAYTVAAVIAAIFLLPSWLAARDVAVGADVWRTDPTRATAILQSAARLNRLSDQAYVVLGTIAERRRDWPQAERWFREAVGRNDGNWYSHLELAVALAKQRHFAAATVEVRLAQERDPREQIVADVARAIRTRSPIDVGAFDRRFIARTTVHSAA